MVNDLLPVLPFLYLKTIAHRLVYPILLSVKVTFHHLVLPIFYLEMVNALLLYLSLDNPIPYPCKAVIGRHLVYPIW